MSSPGITAWRTAAPAVAAFAAVAVALAAAAPGELRVVLPLAALIVLCGAGIVHSVATGLRPVALVVFAFAGSWLGVGPAYQLATGIVPWGDASAIADRALVSTALWLTTLAIACFWAGVLVAGGIWPRSRRRTSGAAHPGTAHRLDEGNGTTGAPGLDRGATVRRWVMWGCIAGATALGPYVIASNGGIASFFTSRADRTEALIAAGITLEETGGAHLALVSLVPVALSVAAAVLSITNLCEAMRGRRPLDAPLAAVIAVAVSVALVVIYANPLANSRFIASLALGSMALALFRPRRRSAALVVAVLTLGAVLIAYPVAEVFRSGAEHSPDHFGLQAFGSYDFDGLQQLVNTIVFVDRHGHSHGWYLLSALLFFVSRSIWDGKARPASNDVADDAGYAFVDLSLPLHAELYLEFGVVGIVLGMAALGALAGRVDADWASGARTRLALLAPVFALSMLGLVRGPLGSLVPVFVTAIALVAVGLRQSAANPLACVGDDSNSRALDAVTGTSTFPAPSNRSARWRP